MRKWRFAWAGGVVAVVFGVACGSSSNAGNDLFGGGEGGGGAAGSGGGGGSGGTAGSGGGAGSAGSGGAGGQGGSGGDACAPQEMDLDRVVSETYALIDASGSMTDVVSTGGTKLGNLVQALQQFVADPRSGSLVLGAAVHPRPDQAQDCIPSAYGPPMGLDAGTVATSLTVVPGLLSDASTQGAWSALLGAAPPQGPSPWQAALQGALGFAKNEQIAHPDREVSVLFLADDQPTECDLMTASAIAAQVVAPFFQGNPSVRTFAIGIGGAGALEGDFAAIASAGGAASWFANPPSTAALVSALEAYRHAVACGARLPKIGGFVPALGTFDVRLASGGTESPLQQVASAAACGADASGGVAGWYPTTGDRVALCPAACDALLADHAAKVRIRLGCSH